MAEPHPDEVIVHSDWYWKIVAAVLAVQFLLIGLAVFSGGIHIGSVFISNAWWVAALAVTYTVSSVRIVPAGWVASVSFLEYSVREIGKGPVPFIFRGLMHITLVPQTMQEDQLPGEPEDISKLPDEEEPNDNKLKPFRILTSGSKPEIDKSEVLNARLAIEPTLSLIWKVALPGVTRFIWNVDGRTWEEKRAFLLKQMRDVAESRLTDIFGQYTLGEIVAGLRGIETRLLSELQAAMGKWGIEILDASIQSLAPDHATNIALGEIPRARAEAQAAVTRAEAEKAAKVLQAEGEKTATLLAAEARSKTVEAEGVGIQLAAAAMGIKPVEYFQGEIMKGAVNKGTLILGKAGVTQLAGLGRLMTKVAQQGDANGN